MEDWTIRGTSRQGACSCFCTALQGGTEGEGGRDLRKLNCASWAGFMFPLKEHCSLPSSRTECSPAADREFRTVTMETWHSQKQHSGVGMLHPDWRRLTAWGGSEVRLLWALDTGLNRWVTEVMRDIKKQSQHILWSHFLKFIYLFIYGCVVSSFLC